ncbi:MAG: hypothetical protein LBF51_01115 [Zoogloeaceae bacterium]|jgi:hypothetical protein|nr:hypothetical protein [Zoogloeaceae bacterium]
MTDKQLLALGILAAGAAAAAYLSIKRDGQTFAASVGGAVVDSITDFASGAIEAAKNTTIGQGMTDIVNHHESMSLLEMAYWDGLSYDKTWQGEDRSMANSFMNGMTWGAWGAGWFGLF